MTDTPSQTIAHRGTTDAGFWWPCWTLMRREIVRFARQRSRVIGALGMPVVFWLLAGSLFGRSLTPADASGPASYIEYTFPAAIGAILMFTAIFSTISLIDDRREGFMQGVLVAPAPRAAIVLGKVLGASALAVAQSVLFMLLGPLVGISLTLGSALASFAAMWLVAFAVTSLGFWIAWRMESTQGFHALMNLVLLPMLLLSGAFAPISDSWTWVRWITTINPMTYCMALLRHTLYLAVPAQERSMEIGWWASVGVSLAFAGAMFVLSLVTATRESQQAAT